MACAARHGTIVAGGDVPERPGYFLRPTIVRDIAEGTRLVDEEQFGPILPVIRSSAVDDAVDRCNGTGYGLGASVWSGDPERAHDVALEGRARRELLLEALETLSPPQAEVLALHFLFDHTIGEIAGMMGTPEETVRSRLRLGKQSLRARIMRDPRLVPLREELS